MSARNAKHLFIAQKNKFLTAVEQVSLRDYTDNTIDKDLFPPSILGQQKTPGKVVIFSIASPICKCDINHFSVISIQKKGTITCPSGDHLAFLLVKEQKKAMQPLEALQKYNVFAISVMNNICLFA